MLLCIGKTIVCVYYACVHVCVLCMCARACMCMCIYVGGHVCSTRSQLGGIIQIRHVLCH